jgi:hypothetical protein
MWNAPVAERSVKLVISVGLFTAERTLGLCERIKRASHELFPIEKFTYWQQWPGS